MVKRSYPFLPLLLLVELLDVGILEAPLPVGQEVGQLGLVVEPGQLLQCHDLLARLPVLLGPQVLVALHGNDLAVVLCPTLLPIALANVPEPPRSFGILAEELVSKHKHTHAPVRGTLPESLNGKLIKVAPLTLVYRTADISDISAVRYTNLNGTVHKYFLR